MFRPACFCFAATILAATALAQQSATPRPSAGPRAPVDALIPWLLEQDVQLRGIPFGQVIFDATGKKVIPMDPQNPTDQRVLKQIAHALNEVVRRLNQPGSIVQAIARINEVSGPFEDLIEGLLNTAPGLSCDFPRTADGHVQRSGYPDLRLVDKETKRVFYLDPKLYAAGSRESSFRTFYFEPRKSTNKVRDDAVHLVIGFEHAAPKEGQWKFTRWDVVDLAHFRVRLKAEFQGSNRDLYRPEAIMASSAK
jgi:hypothetical protein